MLRTDVWDHKVNTRLNLRPYNSVFGLESVAIHITKTVSLEGAFQYQCGLSRWRALCWWAAGIIKLLICVAGAKPKTIIALKTTS